MKSKRKIPLLVVVPSAYEEGRVKPTRAGGVRGGIVGILTPTA